MNDIENAAMLLRRKISDAEISGQIKSAEAVAYIEMLYKIEKILVNQR